MNDKELFEKWMSEEQNVHSLDKILIAKVYDDYITQSMWAAWQAAVSYNKPPTGYEPCKNQCEAIAARKMIKQLKAENELLKNNKS